MLFNRGLALVLLLGFPVLPQPFQGIPRRLTVAQQRALLFAARPYKGQKVAISHLQDDVERRP